MSDRTRREIILDTAAMLVQERDIAALTFGDVAAAAEISEDELARDFPTLDHLVEGVADRMYRAFMVQIEAELGDDDSPGAWTRAYIRACNRPEVRRDFPRISRALLSTVAYKPELIEPLRQAQPGLFLAMERDGLDPMVAYTVRVAMEGLFLAEMFGMNLIPEDARDDLVDHLTGLTRTSGSSTEPE